ncbi:MAG: DoxX family protein [Candidatus Dormibacteria bacterium]
MMNVGILLIRVTAGLVVSAHGAQKLLGWFGGPGIDGFSGWLGSLSFRPARFWAYAAALVETAGGVLVALGLLTPLAAFAVMAAMIIAVSVHLPRGFFAQGGGFEYPAVLAAVMGSLALTGAGVFSLDHVLGIAISTPAVLATDFAGCLVGVACALASRRLGEPTTQARNTIQTA